MSLRARRRRSRRHAPTRGQTPSEILLVLPVLAILLVGVLDGGRVALIQNAVARAASDGVRYASANDGSLRAVEDWVRKRAPMVPSPDVDVWCQRRGTRVTTCEPGDEITVRIRSEVHPLTPVVGDLVGPIRFEATSRTMVPH